MTKPLATDLFDDMLCSADDPDFPTTPWSLDELDHSTDLGSIRSAWASSSDLYD